MNKFLLLFFVSILSVVEVFAQCNTPTGLIPPTNGQVNCMELDTVNSKLYFGGNFTTIDPFFTKGTELDPTTGVENRNFPVINGNVTVAIADGNGGWFIGGAFTSVGGLTRNRIAQIDAGGNVTNWDPNANGAVNTMLLDGTKLYVGGAFTSIGGASRKRLAELDVNTGLSSSWNPNVNSTVLSMALSSSNTIYTGGAFTFIGDSARTRIAEIDLSTGKATSWKSSANKNVNAILYTSNRLFVGGVFTTINGAARKRIAEIDVTTGAATSWNPNSNGIINVLKEYGADIIAAGAFTSIGGQTRNRIASLDLTIGIAGSIDPEANGAVNSLEIYGNTLYIGGAFSTILGEERIRIAAFDLTTLSVLPFSNIANSTVSCLAISSDALFAGGIFSAIGGISRNRIAAVSTVDGSLLNWNPSASSTVSCLERKGSTIYVGGAFTFIGGQFRNRLAAISTNSALANSWNPDVNNVVMTLKLIQDTIYFAGSFTKVNGATRSRIASVDLSTGDLTNWAPSFNSSIRSIDSDFQTLFVGGDFTSAGGQTRNRLAAINLFDGSLNAWDPNSNGKVYAVRYANGSVYVGGAFTTIAGLSAKRAAKLDLSGTLDPSWVANSNNQVFTIFNVDDQIIVGGKFTSIGGVTRNRLAALDSLSGLANSWNPSMNSEVYCIESSNSAIFVGGAFTKAGSSDAKYISDFSLPPTFSINPTDIEICELTDTAITVASTNAISFQWQVNEGSGFTNITNNSNYSNSSTSKLVINDLPFSFNGNIYRCVVTDNCGLTSASSESELSILPAPTVSVSITSSTEICENENLLLIANESTNYTYQWQKNGSDINAETNDSIYVDKPADYSVIVTDENTCSNTSTEITITNLPISEVSQNIEICFGSNYTIGSNTYTTSGTYTDYFDAVNGCDSIVTTELTVLPENLFTNNTSVCSGFGINVGANYYDASGTYVDVLTDSRGCDSTVTTVLLVEDTIHFYQNVELCDGDSIVVGTSTYKIDGSYSDTLVAIIGGCDSIIYTNVLVHPIPQTTVDTTICSNQFYSIGNNSYNSPGTFIDTLTSVFGCDSIITSNVTVLSIATATNNLSICDGDSVLIGSSVYKLGGTFQDVFTMMNGCDSVVTTNITILPVHQVSQDINLCFGESYTIGSNTYSSDGVYTDTLINISGCDSIVETTLIINPLNSLTQNITLCSGQFTIVGSNTYSTEGTYNDILTDVFGCDSLITTNIAILPPNAYTQNIQICTGQIFAVDTNVYSESGTYVDILIDVNGCDSTLTTNLEVTDEINVSQSFTICNGESITVGTNVHNTEGTFIDVLTANAGCDSVVTTTITLLPSFTNLTEASICPGGTYTFNGNIYSTAGTYTDSFLTVLGCDSLEVLELEVNETYNINNPQSLCEGDSYTINGNVYSSSGTYIDLLTSSEGCDSVVTTILTFNSLPIVVANASETELCQFSELTLTGSGAQSYIWSDGFSDGVASSLEGTTEFFVTGTDVNGCEDIDSITVIANPVPTIELQDEVQVEYMGSYVLEPIVSSDAFSFLWKPSTFLSSDAVQNPTAEPETNIVYVLEVTDSSGCVNADSISVTLYGDLIISNFISPNNDEINDTWLVNAPSIVKDYSVKILDSWGQIIFEKENGYNNEWDGTQNGKELPDGTYYYIFSKNNKAVYKGSITLTR